MKSVTADKFAAIVDVRRPEEYKEGHLKDSKLFTLDTITKEKAEKLLPDKSKPILVYCRTGIRSLKAVEMLRSFGYTNAQSLEGGINAWIAAGSPTVK